MGSHGPFGHLQHTLWQKEGSLKSQESTQPWCMQVECDTPLESSRGKLQVCFEPHPNWRFEQRVMTLQSLESPNWNSFGTLPWLGVSGQKAIQM